MRERSGRLHLNGPPPRCRQANRCLARIDALPWTAGFSFTTHGLVIGVRTSAPDVLPELARRLPPDARPSRRRSVDVLFSVLVGGDGPRPGTRRFHLLYGGITRLARTHDLAAVYEAFERELEQHVAAVAPGRVFLHAGVVGWRGRAIVVPGRSGSGKSRLVESLVRAGATYYSDEYAVLDFDGRVHPFARPLKRRERDGRVTPLPPRAIGAAVGRTPLPVGLILVTRYERGAPWRPSPLTRGQAVLELLAHAIAARCRPRDALRAIGHATRRARALRGNRGESRLVAAKILAEESPAHAGRGDRR